MPDLPRQLSVFTLCVVTWLARLVDPEFGHLGFEETVRSGSYNRAFQHVPDVPLTSGKVQGRGRGRVGWNRVLSPQ